MSSSSTVGTFLDFFSGSGLVTEGLKSILQPMWANDISDKKCTVYRANHGNKYLVEGSIELIHGKEIPTADLAWASFPCQDLSLAGNQSGIDGSRSGLVWEWLKRLNEMEIRPKVLAIENVPGLVSISDGQHYLRLHQSLNDMGFRCGAVLLDAVDWVPQSRSRVFVIAVEKTLNTNALEIDGPTWCHGPAIEKIARKCDGWIWWNLPKPPPRKTTLSHLIEDNAPFDKPATISKNISIISQNHKDKIRDFQNDFVFPGYKRTRNGTQVLELRFDGIAGCLRTPKGGSSRQTLLLKRNGKLLTRLITIRECARLMGAPDSYIIPGSYNDGYYAMGDAVVVPVISHLGKHLLRELVLISQKQDSDSQKNHSQTTFNFPPEHLFAT